MFTHCDWLGHLGCQIIQHWQNALVILVAVLNSQLPSMVVRKDMRTILEVWVYPCVIHRRGLLQQCMDEHVREPDQRRYLFHCASYATLHRVGWPAESSNPEHVLCIHAVLHPYVRLRPDNQCRPDPNWYIWCYCIDYLCSLRCVLESIWRGWGCYYVMLFVWLRKKGCSTCELTISIEELNWGS